MTFWQFPRGVHLAANGAGVTPTPRKELKRQSRIAAAGHFQVGNSRGGIKSGGGASNETTNPVPTRRGELGTAIALGSTKELPPHTLDSSDQEAAAAPPEHPTLVGGMLSIQKLVHFLRASETLDETTA
jgi:hypothetical protein